VGPLFDAASVWLAQSFWLGVLALAACGLLFAAVYSLLDDGESFEESWGASIVVPVVFGVLALLLSPAASVVAQVLAVVSLDLSSVEQFCNETVRVAFFDALMRLWVTPVPLLVLLMAGWDRLAMGSVPIRKWIKAQGPWPIALAVPLWLTAWLVGRLAPTTDFAALLGQSWPEFLLLVFPIVWMISAAVRDPELWDEAQRNTTGVLCLVGVLAAAWSAVAGLTYPGTLLILIGGNVVALLVLRHEVHRRHLLARAPCVEDGARLLRAKALGGGSTDDDRLGDYGRADTERRCRAIELLRCHHPEAESTLYLRLLRDPNSGVAKAAFSALEGIGPEATTRGAREMLRHSPSPECRFQAAEFLIRAGHADGYDGMQALGISGSTEAIDALLALGPPAREYLVRIAQEANSEQSRFTVATHLIAAKDPRGLDAMLRLVLALEDRDFEVYRPTIGSQAIEALQAVGQVARPHVIRIATAAKAEQARYMAAQHLITAELAEGYEAMLRVALGTGHRRQNAVKALVAAGLAARTYLVRIAQEAKEEQARFEVAEFLLTAKDMDGMEAMVRLALGRDSSNSKAVHALIAAGSAAHPYLERTAAQAQVESIRLTAAQAILAFPQLRALSHSTDAGVAAGALTTLLEHLPASRDALAEIVGRPIDDEVERKVRAVLANPMRALGGSSPLASMGMILLRGRNPSERERLAREVVGLVKPDDRGGACRALVAYCVWRATEDVPKRAPFPLLAEIGDTVVPQLVPLLDTARKSDRKLALKALLSLRRRSTEPVRLRALIEANSAGLGPRGRAKLAELFRLWDTSAVPSRWDWRSENRYGAAPWSW